MAATGNPGHQTTISIGGTSYAFDSCTLGKHGQILERRGIRGTRSHNITDTRLGPYRVSGTVSLEPSPAELLSLMTLAIGTGGNVAETMTSFNAIVNRTTTVKTYTNCRVNRATLRGRQGEILSLALDLVGETETTGSAPAAPASAAPYIFSDVVLTLQSSARAVQEFELVIDNALIVDRFQNTLTVTDIPTGDRIVTLRSVHDYDSDNSALYDQAIAGATGTLVANDGTTGRTFTFGVLQVPAETPPIEGKGLILLTLDMVARKSGNIAEIAVT